MHTHGVSNILTIHPQLMTRLVNARVIILSGERVRRNVRRAAGMQPSRRPVRARPPRYSSLYFAARR